MPCFNRVHRVPKWPSDQSEAPLVYSANLFSIGRPDDAAPILEAVAWLTDFGFDAAQATNILDRLKEFGDRDIRRFNFVVSTQGVAGSGRVEIERDDANRGFVMILTLPRFFVRALNERMQLGLVEDCPPHLLD